MRLHVEEIGTGPRTAILVHGILSDHGAWCRVAPALADRDYRVLMPDLRGHGFSPRGEYSPDAWAGDLVESLPSAVDLAIGHSLGGMELSLAVDELRPSRAAYIDPAWKTTAAQDARYGRDFRAQLQWDAAQLRAHNPRWSDEDIEARVASMARFEPRCIDGLLSGDGHDRMPTSRSIPSLLMLADPSDLVPPPDAATLAKLGFDVRSVPGSGHSIFRDDLAGFLACMDRWLAS